MRPPTPRTELVRAATPPADAAPWVLTGLDRANLFLVLRGTRVFEGGLDADRLKDGLARLLSSYPTLAGRMRRCEVVEPTGDGVPFTEASEPGLSVAELCDDHALAAGDPWWDELLHPGDA